ncbi:MAG: T9SS type A sorting domain-containing protein [Candidatus Aegiribacteria sp.]|nr:T9SS type A sorting domain-containing protein [Candidatus Aegiribacteria sp.]MBD3294291.1 T9SS type A sorting domain-containing protein [Candidatus Fermentibacteria bacterium]
MKQSRLALMVFTVLFLSFSQLSAQQMPQARSDHLMLTYWGTNCRVVLFGGQDASGNFLNDLWEYDGSWSELSPTGTLPPVRAGHCGLVYSDRLYIFGGEGETEYYNDMWYYDFAGNEWTEVTYASDAEPEPRKYAVMAYMMDLWTLYGGAASYGSQYSDFWSFDSDEALWEDQEAVMPPSAGNTMCIKGNQHWAYGGIRWDPNDYRDDDRYCNFPGSWTYGYTSGDNPPPLAFPAFADRPVTESLMYMFGGENEDGTLGDLYSFDKVNTEWTNLSTLSNSRNTPPPLSHGGLAYYTNGSDTSLVMFGGLDSTGTAVGNAWSYNIQAGSWSTVGVSEGPEAMTVQELSVSAAPNPFLSSLTVSFSPAVAQAELFIYSADGRIVRTLTELNGTSSFIWDGRTQDGIEAPAGVYILEISSNEAVESNFSKVVKTR